MTTEEKAKAYDEALEKIKVLQEDWKSTHNRAWIEIEEVFPQLAESEDEKMRKELIFFLKEEIPQCSIKEHADKLKEFVAYLERKKEPKPAEWSEEDGAILNSIIRIITHVDDLAHEPTYAGPKWTHPYTKELNFLKKLRNRHENNNNT